jgi:hypothetical protein
MLLKLKCRFEMIRPKALKIGGRLNIQIPEFIRLEVINAPVPFLVHLSITTC